MALTREEMVNFLPRWRYPLAGISAAVTHWGQVGLKVQRPHWQRSSLGIPRQPQPLAPWSQEKFQLWPYKAGTRNLLPCSD